MSPFKGSRSWNTGWCWRWNDPERVSATAISFSTQSITARGVEHTGCLHTAGKRPTLLLSWTKAVNDLPHGMLGEDLASVVAARVVTATTDWNTMCDKHWLFDDSPTGSHYRKKHCENTSCSEFAVLHFGNDYTNQSQVWINFHPPVPSLDPQRN